MYFNSGKVHFMVKTLNDIEINESQLAKSIEVCNVNEILIARIRQTMLQINLVYLCNNTF